MSALAAKRLQKELFPKESLYSLCCLLSSSANLHVVSRSKRTFLEASVVHKIHRMDKLQRRHRGDPDLTPRGEPRPSSGLPTTCHVGCVPRSILCLSPAFRSWMSHPVHKSKSLSSFYPVPQLQPAAGALFMSTACSPTPVHLIKVAFKCYLYHLVNL